MRFNKVNELIEHLRSIYAPRETVYEALGKLSNIYQKTDETVIAFANHVRELEKGILHDCKQEYGSTSQVFAASTNKNLQHCFLRGLNPEIAIRMQLIQLDSINETISRAILVEKENTATANLRGLLDARSENRSNNSHPVLKINSQSVIFQLCRKSEHETYKARKESR
ncbi:hypothetical protein WH47_04093 [Habropoda laboriosa]|uniref:Uncharacterized protein n=1 Tax=Habropoda laboriosa TaxID=597456 RepID=A0A0L7QXP0_9HYME|nr:hypothetical protein WH47_04093 [Habropoda laboriosa]